MATELRETIPTFIGEAEGGAARSASPTGRRSTSQGFARNWGEVVLILARGGRAHRRRGIRGPRVRCPERTSSRRRARSARRLSPHFGDLFWPHLLVTLNELLVGFAIGAIDRHRARGGDHAVPVVEKIITPYILLLVTTPMIALVPLLILELGFRQHAAHHRGGAGLWPDGDDQRGDRLPPHRSGQDRARPLVRRDHVPDFHQSALPAGAADDHRRSDGRRDLRHADGGRRRDGRWQGGLGQSAHVLSS